MAVYKKTYRPYDGALTSSVTRFLVIPRYAFEDLRKSRFLTIFFLASFIYPLICALIIYVQHNVSALNLLGVQGANRLISINVTFFLNFLGWQSMLALFLAAFIGPGQVSPDLANNALSLYLARPFSRVEYVLGKMSVLVVLMSLMTWVPGLLLFLLQGYLEEAGPGCTITPAWRWACSSASWVWILVLALLALALSAWVKWKPAAGALMFGVFFVAGGFGAAINGVQRTRWGHLFNISELIGSVWVQLFGADPAVNNGGVFFRVPAGEELPLWCCWARAGGALPDLPLHAGAQDPRRGGGAVSDERIDHLRQRLALLRRSAGRQQGQPVDSARHHQPGGPERLRQDHADEPDDRPDPPHPGRDHGAGHVPRRSRTALPRGRLLRAVRRLPQGPHRLPVHLLLPAHVRHERPRSATSAPWPRSRPSA